MDENSIITANKDHAINDILQADYDRIRRGVPRDQIRDVGRVGALHGHQDRAGICENRGIVREQKLARCDLAVEALEAGHAQTVGIDFRDHAVAREQRYAAARIRKNASDKTADAAGTGHADGLGRDHAGIPDEQSFKSDSRVHVHCLLPSHAVAPHRAL